MHADLIATLRKAEDAAWHAINTPDSDTATAVHQAIAAALRIAETAAAGPRCEFPACGNAIEHSGVGRRRRFCSDRCRKAAHRASRQR